MRVRRHFFAAMGLLAALCLGPHVARAQFGLPGRAPTADSVPSVVSTASPRAALQDFLRYAEANEWESAAEFLSVPAAQRRRAAQLARRLKAVLDQRLDIDIRTVSGAVVGDTTDGDVSGDRIGMVAAPNGHEDPVRMVPVAASSSDRSVRWVFSQATVGLVDGWFENLGAPWLRERLPAGLMREGPLNVYLWQWIGLGLAIPIVILVAWGLGAVLRSVLIRIVRRTVTDWDDLLLMHLRAPFRLWAASLAIGPLLSWLELNARVNGFFVSLTRGLVLISIFWGLLSIVRLVQERVANAAWATGQGTQARTLVPLLGNILRVTLAVIALLVALSQFGYPVGTLLAGLGIGGIAIALAAQKTVENLFGSVSLAADNAFRVGDWVRAGGSEGAVERIGLRSTSIRTVDRTVVRIPNGRLADERIETFGERDRILLRTDIDLTYGTTPEQLAHIRDGIESALRAHPLIYPDVMRVNVVAFTDSAIRMNVVSWFKTTNWEEFLRIRHDMLITFMRVIDENGSSFAFPSRTVYHVQQQSAKAAPGIGAGAPTTDV